MKKDKNVLVVADGAAFGSEVEKIELYARQNNNCYLYLPESFEWLILKSGVIKNADLSAILQNTCGQQYVYELGKIFYSFVSRINQ